MTAGNRHPAIPALLAATLLSTSGDIAAAGDTHRILPLGNSITQATAAQASYRFPLWKHLVNAGLSFDFVGSMNAHLQEHSQGPPPQPDYRGRAFDRDHEGHFGWTADEIINGRGAGNGSGSGKLAEWLESYDVDMALVHLGTNDAFGGHSDASTVDELKEIIRILRAGNPEVVVLLARLIPAAHAGGAIESLNEAIPRVAHDMHTARSPVVLVDHFRGFDARQDTYDGVHPNESGEKKMARRWFDAIMQVVAPGR